MRVLLINPPSRAPYPVLPLGLAYIGAYLRDRGIEVRAIDAWAARLSLSQLQDRIAGSAPDIVGVTMNTPNYEAGRQTAVAVRAAAPTATIVLGGAHPSALPGETLLGCAEADIAVEGEGEEVMARICRAGGRGGDLREIPGLVFRSEGGIVRTEKAPPTADLDSFPFPGRDLFPLRLYQTHPPYGKRNPYSTLITQRGCPFHCSYCSKSVFGKKFRQRSVENVIAEIDSVVSRFGVKELHFYDDIFTINAEWVRNFCLQIRRTHPELIWSCTTRVDLVEESLLGEMKSAGCWLISYGVESGSQEILDSVNKGYRLEQVRKAFAETKKAGIRTVAFYMIGFPGDDESSIRKTIDFVIHLRPDFSSLGIGVLLPGSELFRRGESPAAKAGRPVEMTPLSEGDYRLMAGKLDQEQLQRWAQFATRKFYFRPGYLLRTFLKIRSFEELAGYLKAGLMTLKWSRE
jgi:anaerobic magnesium-protoporphyrin IX monomethyl ester cyclase